MVCRGFRPRHLDSRAAVHAAITVHEGIPVRAVVAIRAVLRRVVVVLAVLPAAARRAVVGLAGSLAVVSQVEVE